MIGFVSLIVSVDVQHEPLELRSQSPDVLPIIFAQPIRVGQAESVSGIQLDGFFTPNT